MINYNNYKYFCSYKFQFSIPNSNSSVQQTSNIPVCCVTDCPMHLTLLVAMLP